MIPENFASHPVFDKLQQLHQLLISDTAKEKVPIADLAFFDVAYKYIGNRLKLTLPILVQKAELSVLASEVETAMTQINTYLGNNNTAHIVNAVNNFNSALNRIKNFPFPLAKGDFDYSKSIAGFEQAVKEGYDNLKAVNEQLAQELKATQKKISANKSQLTTFEKNLAAKEIEITNALGRYNTEFEKLKATASSSIESERKKFVENTMQIENHLKNDLMPIKKIIEKFSKTKRTNLKKNQQKY